MKLCDFYIVIVLFKYFILKIKSAINIIKYTHKKLYIFSPGITHWNLKFKKTN